MYRKRITIEIIITSSLSGFPRYYLHTGTYRDSEAYISAVYLSRKRYIHDCNERNWTFGTPFTDHLQLGGFALRAILYASLSLQDSTGTFIRLSIIAFLEWLICVHLIKRLYILFTPCQKIYTILYIVHFLCTMYPHCSAVLCSIFFYLLLCTDWYIIVLRSQDVLSLTFIYADNFRESLRI